MSKNKPHNPYASAAGAYDQHAQTHTPDQREVEARVLLKAAKAMQELQQDWDSYKQEELDDVLTYNRQIWLMFVDTAIEDKNPERTDDLRSNIANLGLFVFNHTVEVLASPAKDKLDVLIEINREIAAGLMTRPAKAAGENAGKTAENSPDENHKTTEQV